MHIQHCCTRLQYIQLVICVCVCVTYIPGTSCTLHTEVSACKGLSKVKLHNAYMYMQVTVTDVRVGRTYLQVAVVVSW